MLATVDPRLRISEVQAHLEVARDHERRALEAMAAGNSAATAWQQAAMEQAKANTLLLLMLVDVLGVRATG